MIKSVIMPGNKQAICVYRLPDGRVYCSDANSTAFEFPLSNAKVITDGEDFKLIVTPVRRTGHTTLFERGKAHAEGCLTGPS